MSIFNSSSNQDVYVHRAEPRDGYEKYWDAADKEQCADHCYYTYMDIHRVNCPLFSSIDGRKMQDAQSQIDIALGK